MNWKLAGLIALGSLLSAPSFAATAGEAALPTPTPSTNPILEKAFDQLGNTLESHPTLASIAMATLGTTPEKFQKHFHALFSDIMEFTTSKSAQDLGGEDKGYAGVTLNVSMIDQNHFAKYLPAALHWYKAREKAGRPTSFEQFRSRFGGDTQEALLAVILSLPWANQRFQNTSFSKTLEAYDPYRYERGYFSLYAPGPFSAKAFGLNLSVTKDTYGKAYKTIAGMNLALALWNKGYATREIVWAVRLASLTYEAADLLYDHLGRAPSDQMSSYQDNPAYVHLNSGYDRLMKKFRELMKKRDFRTRIQYSVMRLKTSLDLFGMIPIPQDSFGTTLLLLAYIDGMPKEFMSDFGQFFKGREGNDLFNLIYASRVDTSTLMGGALFSLSALQAEDQTSSKPDLLSRVQTVLSVGDFLLDPIP